MELPRSEILSLSHPGLFSGQNQGSCSTASPCRIGTEYLIFFPSIFMTSQYLWKKRRTSDNSGKVEFKE